MYPVTTLSPSARTIFAVVRTSWRRVKLTEMLDSSVSMKEMAAARNQTLRHPPNLTESFVSSAPQNASDAEDNPKSRVIVLPRCFRRLSSHFVSFSFVIVVRELLER